MAELSFLVDWLNSTLVRGSPSASFRGQDYSESSISRCQGCHLQSELLCVPISLYPRGQDYSATRSHAVRAVIKVPLSPLASTFQGRLLGKRASSTRAEGERRCHCCQFKSNLRRVPIRLPSRAKSTQKRAKLLLLISQAFTRTNNKTSN